MWILLFKTVLKSPVIKSSVVRECIKERLLTLSTAVTGPNPWEENSEFSMQKVCWGLFLDQQLEGREEYRWGRGALLLVTRETLQVLGSSGAEATLVKGSQPLPLCYLQILHAQCPWNGAWHWKRWHPFTEGSIQRDKPKMWVPGIWRTCLQAWSEGVTGAPKNISQSVHCLRCSDPLSWKS